MEFASPDEYNSRAGWLEDRVRDGTLERIPVVPEHKLADHKWEWWSRCLESGEVWSLIRR